ncbi:MAG: retropepsin-like domain-containing protein [Defluviitaleaceae bacterium]|nr:retropepsin-like domain-containing protein [Defluviitaleaceae bacterium]MCL2264035.1 retropepsin-like domain-containing protein [Defluviitaleaceae bacterium]
MDSLLTVDLMGSKTIPIKCYLYSPKKDYGMRVMLIYDTGADKTSLTKDTLEYLGYTNFKQSARMKRTALGVFSPPICDLSRLVIGNQFSLLNMPVDVMEIENTPGFHGVIGMDFISRVESLISGSNNTLTITGNLQD